MTKKVQVKGLYELAGYSRAVWQSISLDRRRQHVSDPEHGTDSAWESCLLQQRQEAPQLCFSYC